MSSDCNQGHYHSPPIEFVKSAKYCVTEGRFLMQYRRNAHCCQSNSFLNNRELTVINNSNLNEFEYYVSFSPNTTHVPSINYGLPNISD